jgi:hypothetical protein
LDKQKEIEELIEDNENFIQLVNDKEEGIKNEDVFYIVRKSVIIEEWRGRCFQKERKKRVDSKSVFKSTNLLNRLT